MLFSVVLPFSGFFFVFLYVHQYLAIYQFQRKYNRITGIRGLAMLVLIASGQSIESAGNMNGRHWAKLGRLISDGFARYRGKGRAKRLELTPAGWAILDELERATMEGTANNTNYERDNL